MKKVLHENFKKYRDFQVWETTIRNLAKKNENESDIYTVGEFVYDYVEWYLFMNYKDPLANCYYRTFDVCDCPIPWPLGMTPQEAERRYREAWPTRDDRVDTVQKIIKDITTGDSLDYDTEELGHILGVAKDEVCRTIWNTINEVMIGERGFHVVDITEDFELNIVFLESGNITYVRPNFETGTITFLGRGEVTLTPYYTWNQDAIGIILIGGANRDTECAVKITEMKSGDMQTDGRELETLMGMFEKRSL